MNSLIARIRWRLVGWNILIIGLILGLAGASVYAAVQRSLLDEVDSTLLARSQQAIPFLFPGRRTDDFAQSGIPGGNLGPGGPRPRTCEGYSGGFFCVAIAPDGSVRANPQDVSVGNIPRPETGQPTFATIELTDGDPARVLLRRMPDGGMLVIGTSLEPTETA
ncbi:MAG TPA: hypothetical protein VFB50_16615, partial [Chloroflexota bacterium]|nr:hypothetical protein [Chloroflexota bacterium]